MESALVVDRSVSVIKVQQWKKNGFFYHTTFLHFSFLLIATLK